MMLKFKPNKNEKMFANIVKITATIMRFIMDQVLLYPSCSLRVAGLTLIGSNNQVKCCVQYSESTAEDQNQQRYHTSLASSRDAKDELLRSK